MTPTPHQRAERVGRLLRAAADITTECARLLRECDLLAPHSRAVNQIAGHLSAQAEALRTARDDLAHDSADPATWHLYRS